MPEKKSIVIVGSINMDLVATAQHIPAAGETILGTGFEMHPGGKGANQAVAAARLAVHLGYPVQMIGQLGSDDLGQQLRDHLDQEGVNTSAIGTVPGSSGVALITVAASGENSIVVAPGANSQVTPTYLDQHADLIRNAGIVLAQLEIPLETVVRLAELCHESNIPFILDPAPAAELPTALFPHITWFTPNETEASYYLDDPSMTSEPDTASEAQSQLSHAAQALLDKGVSGVILKSGSKGSYLFDRAGHSAQIQPFQVQAVDTTAAGDAFNGAFATALMLGHDPIAAANFASAAAAISVTRPGAQSSMATLDEVHQLLRSAGREL